MAEKNMWYFGAIMTSVLKLALAISGAVPLITYLVMGEYDMKLIDVQFLFWAIFWIVYFWNGTGIFRLQKQAWFIAIALDFVYVVFFWNAFLKVGVSFDVLSIKALHGLLPACFIIFLILPSAKKLFK
jgi:hypothetical protein